MKCPMLKSRYVLKREPDHPNIEVAQFQDCIGKECAWWAEYHDVTFRNCALPLVVQFLFERRVEQ